MPTVTAEPTRTPKAEQTRAHILATALALFRERGYERTTMRAVAEAAGVSVGNAYYHFESKEHLIQAYYGQVHAELDLAAQPILERERTLRKRLLGVLHSQLDLIEPYHDFAGVLFRTAADPSSPLSPFSPESLPVRQASTRLMAELVDGSSAKVDNQLREELPHLLWLYHMGVILFWVHDQTPGAKRTRELVDRTVPVIDRLIKLARVPGLGPVAHQIVRIARDLRTFVGETEDGHIGDGSIGDGHTGDGSIGDGLVEDGHIEEADGDDS